MAIDFPTPTQVGQVYTDPTSGNTYVCVVLGPPAEWSGSSDNADLDQTYLRTDASNGPVSGNLGIGGSAAAPNIILGTGGTIAGPNTSVANKYSIDASGTVSLGGSPTTPNMKLESGGEATTRNVFVYGSNSSFADGLLRSGLDMDLSESVKYGRLYSGSGSTTAAAGTGLRFLTEPIGGVVPSVCMEISPTGTVGIGSNTAAYNIELNGDGSAAFFANSTANKVAITERRVKIGNAATDGDGINLGFSGGALPRLDFYASANAKTGSLGLNYASQGVGSFALTTVYALQLGGNNSTYFSGAVPTTSASGPSFARLNSEGFGLRLYISTSLRAAKTNIESLNYGTDLCKALRPVVFTSALEDDLKMFHGDEQQIGFIAEEVEEVHSGLCSYDSKEKALSGVAYDRIGAIAIAALQEALTRIETLESEVATLKGA